MSLPSVLAAIDYRTCRQGCWDDCWLISALVSLAHHRPAEAAGLVRVVGDDDFEVTFPGRGPVAVRRGEGGGTASDGGWAEAIETAAYRFTDAVTCRMMSFGEGVSLLTGRGRTGYTNVTGAGFAPLWRAWSRTAWLEQRLANATAAKRVMVLGGSDGYWTTPKVDGIMPRHCYALLGYDPGSGTCRVRDPRGADDAIPQDRKRDGYGPAEFWLTLAELEGSFCGLTIEDE